MIVYNEKGLPIEYTLMCTFMGDNCQLYAALIPDEEPAGANGDIILVFAKKTSSTSEEDYVILTVEENVKAARYYFSCLPETSQAISSLDDDEE